MIILFIWEKLIFILQFLQKINFATIELITTEAIADGIEEEVNARLTRDNGYSAFLRFVAYAEHSDGRFRYVAE